MWLLRVRAFYSFIAYDGCLLQLVHVVVSVIGTLLIYINKFDIESKQCFALPFFFFLISFFFLLLAVAANAKKKIRASKYRYALCYYCAGNHCCSDRANVSVDRIEKKVPELVSTVYRSLSLSLIVRRVITRERVSLLVRTTSEYSVK